MTILQSVKRQALQQGFELKTFDHEYTRKTASILAVLSLIKKEEGSITAQSIDNECFDLLNFTLSHTKTHGKSKGNMLKRRLPKYINNHLFMYSAIDDLVKLTAQGKAVLLQGKRQLVSNLDKIRESVKRVHAKKLKVLQEKCTFKFRKAILTIADKKHISNMLYNHIK